MNFQLEQLKHEPLQLKLIGGGRNCMPRFGPFIRSLLGLTQESREAVTSEAMDTRPAVTNEFVSFGKRTVTTDGFNVELDLSNQLLAITTPKDIDWDFDFYSDGDFRSGPADAPLRATLGQINETAVLSASVLVQKAKIFDDGLYAAVEVAAQEGAGGHAGRATLLGSLGRALAVADPSVSQTAQELLLGAASLGNVSIGAIPSNVEPVVRHSVEAFLANELRSKPVGFYTWSAELRRIFQQDRMLQSEIDATGIKAIANALHTDPVARDTYERHLRLVSRLTNPFAIADLRNVLEAIDRGFTDVAEDEDIRFFPPSIAHETNLIKKLYGDRPIPNDFVLADEMIRRIRSGEVDLEPSGNSGWYDYQTWALEPLVIPERMPEGKQVQLDDEYRKLLLELFKGTLTLTRETHIKQLEIPLCGSALGEEREFIDITPQLSAEPLATFYHRRAIGYRYVRTVLEDSFGSKALQSLHRLTEFGPVSTCLAEELDAIETLFFGSHVTVSRELGLVPESVPGSKVSANYAAQRFTAWVRELRSDPDLSMDLRAMVPVFYDVQRRKTKVWAFLGWSHRPIVVSFARPPKAMVRDLTGRLLSIHPPIRWGGIYTRLPYPVTAEFYVDRILDRDEFRKLCDSCVTRSAILKRLDA